MQFTIFQLPTMGTDVSEALRKDKWETDKYVLLSRRCCSPQFISSIPCSRCQPSRTMHDLIADHSMRRRTAPKLLVQVRDASKLGPRCSAEDPCWFRHRNCIRVWSSFQRRDVSENCVPCSKHAPSLMLFFPLKENLIDGGTVGARTDQN